MPIVTITEDNQTRYHAVTEGYECRLDALVTEFALSDSTSREYAEHALQREYLKRLTAHAYDCAQLAHLTLNPPDTDDPVGSLNIVDPLARKVAREAVWLRTYDPFTGLTAEAVADEGEGVFGTLLQIGDERVSSLDDDSWDASETAHRERSPQHRDNLARIELEKAAKRDAEKFTPAGAKRIDKAWKECHAAIDYAHKLKKRSEKTVANKTVRRRKAVRK